MFPQITFVVCFRDIELAAEKIYPSLMKRREDSENTEVFPTDIDEFKERDAIIGIARKGQVVTRNILQYEVYLQGLEAGIEDFITQNYRIAAVDLYTFDTEMIYHKTEKPIAFLAFYWRSFHEFDKEAGHHDGETEEDFHYKRVNYFMARL
jgi:hypothetical protein